MFFLGMAFRPKKNQLWTVELEITVIEFYKTNPELWCGRKQKETEHAKSLFCILVDRLGKLFTGILHVT